MVPVLENVTEAELQKGIRPGMKITEDEMMRLPKDGRKYELVDGRLKEVPTGWLHDEISLNLAALILPHARGRGSMSSGQAGFRMTDGNLRAPDVSFTRRERIPGGRTPLGFGGVAPDLCVELISPSEERTDMARKVREYFEAGAEQVWHVLPERQQVVVFTSPTNTRTLNAEDTLTAGDLLPGFSCRVGDLFLME